MVDAYPGLEVCVSFTAAMATPTWTNITGWVDLSSELSFGGGRQYELDVIEPGQCSLLLDNSDGRFTGGNPASPYYPYVLPQRRIRIRGQIPGGTWVDEWHGRILGWPTTWPGGSKLYATAQISASDLTARLKRRNLHSAFAEEILLDKPAAWWPLDDPVGSLTAHEGTGQWPPSPLIVATDQAGTSTATAVFGAAGITPQDAGTALAFTAPKTVPPSGGYPWWLPTLVNKQGPVLALGANGFTIEAIVLLTAGAGVAVEYPDRVWGSSTIYAQGRNNSPEQVGYGTAGYAPYPDVELGIDWYTTTGVTRADPYAIVGGARLDWAVGNGGIGAPWYIDDGRARYLKLTVTAAGVGQLFLTNVVPDIFSGAVASRSGLTVPANPDWAGIGAHGNRSAGSSEGQTWFVGTIQHVAIHNKVVQDLTGRRFAAFANNPDLADLRIARMLQYAGWPVDSSTYPATGDVALDGYVEYLGAASCDGVDPWTAVQTAAADDGGVAYLSRTGLATYHNRRRIPTNITPAVVLDCARQDVAADLTFLLDDTRVATIVEVTSAAAKVRAVDPVQQADYGDLTLAKAMNIWAAPQLGEAASAILGQVSTPKPRGGTVTVDILGQTDTIKTWALQADLGDRIQLTNLPAQAPTPTMDFIVESRIHGILRGAGDGHWQLKMEVSPAPIPAGPAGGSSWVVENTLCDTGYVVGW